MNDETRQPLIPQTLVIGGRVVDGRTLPARRYRAVCGDLATDLGGDPSTGQWLLVQRAAGLVVQLEMLEQEIVQGKAIDPATYSGLVGTLTRTLKTLGLERRAKDVTPTGPIIDAHAAAVRDAVGT